MKRTFPPALYTFPEQLYLQFRRESGPTISRKFRKTRRSFTVPSSRRKKRLPKQKVVFESIGFVTNLASGLNRARIKTEYSKIGICSQHEFFRFQVENKLSRENYDRRTVLNRPKKNNSDDLRFLSTLGRYETRVVCARILQSRKIERDNCIAYSTREFRVFTL